MFQNTSVDRGQLRDRENATAVREALSLLIPAGDLR
jgi:hypothetical protein